MTCTLCELHKTAKTICIPGRGSANPDIVFVGQAPGEQEDQRGRVFCGPAGILLEEAVREYKLQPGFITNVVRCFPPKDRAPKKEEIAACKPYLLEELKQFKPKVIVALGTIPLRVLTGKHGIMDYSGQVVGELNGAKVFALYHPDYIVKVQKDLHKFEMHLRALRDLLKGQAEELDIKVDQLSAKEAVKILIDNLSEVITFDFETTGKMAWAGGELRCVGFNVAGKNFVVSAEDKDFNRLMEFVVKTCDTLQAHNSIFEMQWCLAKWGVCPKVQHDTMLMHHLVDENSSHDLEAVASQYLQVKSWGIHAKMIEKGWGWGDIPYNELAYYCGLDCHYTAEIGKKLRAEISSLKLEKFYNEVYQPLARLCAFLEYRGLKIDREFATSLRDQYEKDCLKLRDKLIVDYKLPEAFNPGSTKQVLKILEGLKVKTHAKTKGGSMSINEKALEPLRGKVPFIDTYLQWNDKQTAISNCLKKYPALLDKSDFVHASFNPGFQVTLRISVSKPPAQNIPEPTRGIVVSRFPGGKLLSSDYKQLEMRLLASEAGEKSLIDGLNRGEDIHDLTALAVFGKGFSEEDRFRAKGINFLTVYGGGAKKLSQSFGVKVDRAKEWLGKFWEARPRIEGWMQLQHKLVRENGNMTSRFGVKRRLPDAQSSDPYVVYRALRQAGNFPIQSQGACITNIAAILVDQYLVGKGLKSLLVHIIHDALLVDVFPGEEKQVKEIVRKIMEEEVPNKWCPWLTVTLPVDQTLTDRWE